MNYDKNMTHKKLSEKELHKQLEEARKDPKFMKEIDTFIKVAESVYPLK